MSEHPLSFGPGYREDVALADGTRLRLRPIEPDDKARLEAGLLELSPESQYFRFFTTKARFTTSELAYLTEVDGWNHFALVAMTLDDEGNEDEGVGVARFVRLPEDGAVAEPAVVVIDAMQRRGIGRLLMVRLAGAAVERGIRTFRSEFLATNAPIRELVRDLSSDARFEPAGSVVIAEFPLPTSMVPVAGPEAPSEAPGPFAPMVDWLRLAGREAVELQRQFTMLFDPERLREAWEKLRGKLPPGRESK